MRKCSNNTDLLAASAAAIAVLEILAAVAADVGKLKLNRELPEPRESKTAVRRGAAIPSPLVGRRVAGLLLEFL